MNELITPSIDVVIPVYNAPVLTKHCIDSVITHLGKSIQKIIIQDDASDTKTRNMLDDLHYESTQVYHAKENNGFGKSVNEAIGRSEASYVLVLNSDTIVRENFLPSLCLALETDPQLAVIIPSGNHYSALNLDQYVKQIGNYILTHRLAGFAFLIRRSVFQELGGFDSVFGRGYYEDIDLGRRLNQVGWRIGVSPNSYIYHKGDALYMSRQPIPTRTRTDFMQTSVYKQVCIIPFRRAILFEYTRLPPTPLEQMESVDMLRLLEHGYRIKMVKTEFITQAVDTEADLARVAKLMELDPLLASY